MAQATEPMNAASGRTGAAPVPFDVAILDNDPLAARSLACILAHDPRRFHVIWQSQSAPEAIQRCLHARVRPRILVCDIALTGMSGMEVCRTIRAAGCDAGVVLVTAYNPAEYVGDAIAVRAQAVLGKNEAVGGLMRAVWLAGHGKGTLGCPDVPVPSDDASEGAAPATLRDAPRLSERERTVMRLFARGLAACDVAVRLGVSRNTVMTHTHRVLRKLHAASREEALEICDRYDLLM